MEENFSWIYLLIFMAIPLARIIPRFLSKNKIKNKMPPLIQEKQSPSSSVEFSTKQNESPKPPTKKMLVLGEINRGSKTFESIQKNTGFDHQELDQILEDLENTGFLKVIHKQGLLGPKVELHPTDKGFKEYYS